MRTTTIALLIFGTCRIACASVPYVTGTYQPTPAGYLVQFVVHNDLDSYCGHWAVSTADAASIVAPEGWGTSQDSRTVSWDAAVLDAYIGPRHSLGGFGYVAQNRPGTVDWWILSGKGYYGSVMPALIPEPSSLAAILAGLAGLGAVMRRRPIRQAQDADRLRVQ